MDNINKPNTPLNQNILQMEARLTRRVTTGDMDVVIPAAWSNPNDKAYHG